MIVAGLSLLVMGGIVTASVLGRVLFLAPIPDDLILVGLLMVPVILLPLAFIERTDGHIVVSILADLLPVRVQALLRAFGALLFGLFFGVIGWVVARKVPREFTEALYYDGRLEVPVWPMKIVFAVGVALLVARLLVTFVSGLRVAFGAGGRSPSEPHREPV